MKRRLERLADVRPEAIDGKAQNATPKFARPVMAQIMQLKAELAQLATVPVPASFTGRKPDTPEARAARAQLRMIKHGESAEVAWQKAGRGTKGTEHPENSGG